MATHAVRKAAHALAEEGELLNVYAELKDLASAFESRMRQQERATKSLLTWTSKKEDHTIEEFVARIGQAEMDSLAVDRRYVEEFRLFTGLWKTVLAEKKELNAKVAAFKRAQKNLEQARKKYLAAETKQPRDEDKLNKARKALESMEISAAEVEKAMHDKLLEVQQEKHTSLRTGYLSLYKATMERLRGLVDQQQVMRDVVNTFPLVVARKGDDEFEYGPAPENEEKPLWIRGEEMMLELVRQRDQYDQQVEKLKAEHSQQMRRVLRERDDVDAQRSESYSAEVVAMAQRNKQILDHLETEHAQALADLHAKLVASEQSLNKTIATLESKVQQLQDQLATKHKQMLANAEEVNKLEDNIEAMKIACTARATNQAKQVISQSIAGLSKAGSVWFLEALQVVKDQHDAFMKLAQNTQEFADFDDQADAFAHACAQLIALAYALAKATKSEESASLLHLVHTFGQAAVALFNAKITIETKKKRPTLSRTLTKGDNVQVVDPDGKRPQLMIAMYDHAASQHGGSVLLGFKKGDIMTLVRKRDDGWCKVIKGNEQGWAPTSYLQELDPAAQKEHQEQQNQAKDKQPALSLEEAGKQFVDALAKVSQVAKVVIARDRELATLSNALAHGIEAKVTAAQQSVLDTRDRIQRITAEIQEKDKGRRLEVNMNLLDLISKLMTVMDGLISAADKMRDALETTKGMQSEDEFNMKHSSWFQGLTTAVDAMVEHNPVLTEALRAVVRQHGKHEELQVSARNLSASVAQLAALSRTKSMPKGDMSQSDINRLSEEFKHTVHEILAAVRECKELDLAAVLLEDYASLSENDAKRLLMATQVNVLKLESDLDREQEKLRRLRRYANYEEKGDHQGTAQ
eukprot:m.74962 g.74962  ORF g.74962 m.74962 type:complete len:864 (+) comp13959_c0_seq1:329-2920(+)